MDYKSTLQLPETAFPMKADLAKREPHLLALWERSGLYAKIQEKRAGSPPFIFHLGPPFANGDAHIGHVLSFTLKDLVAKTRNMAGFRVPMIPGWDCHGLPIEHKVVKELGDQGGDPVKIREKSAEMARKFIDIQRGQFRRLGMLADWENPYITMDPGYEAEVLRGFASIVGRDLVYQGLRPVSWSTGCQTALAEAEVEYVEKTDPAIFVKFPLTMESAQKLGVPEKTSLLVWTTTPWTLPANLAVAVSEKLSYGVYEVNGVKMVVQTDLAGKAPGFEGCRLLGTSFAGTKLVGATYHHPFLERTGNVYPADFVTADAGTGIVHIAPGHGADDYFLGKQHGLEAFSPVDDRGCLTEACGVPELVGQYVFKANPLVIGLLEVKDRLWAREDYVHDYPHCWRSKTPIVFRSVPQWFIKVDAFRATALEEIDRVRWIPAWGRNRIHGAVSSRPDWCISRQRSWGIPIPAFFDQAGQPVMTEASVRAFADLVEKEGTDVWFKTGADALAARLGLPAGLTKGRDTLDVWIDSGSSQAAVVKKRLSFPADLYLEGSDQHRGWFNSSLCLSVMTNGCAPYRSVLTHGFIVDEQGKKYSKSSGATDSTTLVGEYGADVLRLWVASQDYTNDVPFSKNILSRVADTYRSVRNTLRILLANLDGFDPALHSIAVKDLDEIDLYLFDRLQEVVAAVRKAYDDYEFYQAYQAINRFCAVDLSAFYVDVLKDRMYCDPDGGARRRSSQTVMHAVLDTLCRLLAPITPFTAEEAWQFMASNRSGEWQTAGLVRDSVHLQDFPVAHKPVLPEGFVARWEKILALRSAANEKLEALRREKIIGKNLEAALEVSASGFSPSDAALLAEVCLVSEVNLLAGEAKEKEQGQGTMEVVAMRHPGRKCVRCWKFFPELGSHPEHPELCPRCTGAVVG
ncbi:MAG: isoleucine--tRNA ligase [Candidatus Methylacidiphilales bacterium]|nr:isoleucine--tRNA ligase [Candidatus Methylacidiphilales bacterium]